VPDKCQISAAFVTSTDYGGPHSTHRGRKVAVKRPFADSSSVYTGVLRPNLAFPATLSKQSALRIGLELAAQSNHLPAGLYWLPFHDGAVLIE